MLPPPPPSATDTALHSLVTEKKKQTKKQKQKQKTTIMKHKKYELFSTVIYPLKRNWEKIGPGKNATDQVIIYTPTG